MEAEPSPAQTSSQHGGGGVTCWFIGSFTNALAKALCRGWTWEPLTFSNFWSSRREETCSRSRLAVVGFPWEEQADCFAAQEKEKAVCFVPQFPYLKIGTVIFLSQGFVHIGWNINVRNQSLKFFLCKVKIIIPVSDAICGDSVRKGTLCMAWPIKGTCGRLLLLLLSRFHSKESLTETSKGWTLPPTCPLLSHLLLVLCY